MYIESAMDDILNVITWVLSAPVYLVLWASANLPSLESLATIIAILAAGYWTYILYIKQRLSYPRINIELSEYKTSISHDYWLLHTFLKIKNTGSVLFRAKDVEVRIRKVLPIAAKILDDAKRGKDPILENKTELDWVPMWKREWKSGKEWDCEIEPGEQDTLHADFIINANVEVVQIYVYVRNESKKELGWSEVRFTNCTPTDTEAKMTDDKKASQEEIPPRQQTQHKPDLQHIDPTPEAQQPPKKPDLQHIDPTPDEQQPPKKPDRPQQSPQQNQQDQETQSTDKEKD